MNHLNTVPSFAHIQEAHQRISPLIARTPVLYSEALNTMFNTNLFFKCENFQYTGSFKLRGASNAIFSLDNESAQNGVATHSSGNHAQAVAYAARKRGIPAYIVMPTNAPKIKIEGVKEYGGQIFFCEPTLEARERTAEEVIAKTGATFIHPFNDYRIIAGQASCAKELIEEIQSLDVIVCPVGGGGLLSGTALSTHYLLPHSQVIAAEPALADDAFRSFHSGKVEPVLSTATIADGLRTSLGEKTLDIMQKYLSKVMLAKEESIVKAMRLIWERLKIVIEPSCAVPLAAIMDDTSGFFQEKKIGIILTGGNVDLDKLPWQ
jgi:threonine dehydratase